MGLLDRLNGFLEEKLGPPPAPRRAWIVPLDGLPEEPPKQPPPRQTVRRIRPRMTTSRFGELPVEEASAVVWKLASHHDNPRAVLEGALAMRAENVERVLNGLLRDLGVQR